MEKSRVISSRQALKNLLWKVSCFLRKCIIWVVSVGEIPTHVAFIMDGNRRYGKKLNLGEGGGHRAGYSAMLLMLIYCFEMGIKYITVYAFSIDNFKRSPKEVKLITDLALEIMERESSDENYSVLNRYGVKVHFAGNLELFSQPLKDAAKRVMAATANNSNVLLTICIAYTSTDETLHAVDETCRRKLADQRDNSFVKLAEIEKHMCMAVAPDPDIIVRTSGEDRLSNFLLWQSASSCLISFSQLWPGIGFWHLVWAVLNFQRNYHYFEKLKKKQL